MKQLREISPLWFGGISLLISVVLIDQSARAVNHNLAQLPIQGPTAEVDSSHNGNDKDISSVERAVRYPYAGFVAVKLTPEYANVINNHPQSSFIVTETDGYLVVHVYPGGPAEKANLQIGDVITFDISPFEHELKFELSDIGQDKKIRVIRGQEFLSLVLSIENQPADLNPEVIGLDPAIKALVTPPPLPDNGAKLGISVMGIGPNSDFEAIREKFKFDLFLDFNHLESQGKRDNIVFVERVHVDSPAYKAGLQAGDVIKTVDNLSITTSESLTDIVQSRHNMELKVGFMRGENSYFTMITPEVLPIEQVYPEQVRKAKEIRSRWTRY